MGEFSWFTQNTNKQIGNMHSNTIEVDMIDNIGNTYYEDNYEGYGVFGGKDFFELLAEMNGYNEDNKKTYARYNNALNFRELRSVGIDMYFDPNWNKKKYISPALMERDRKELNISNHNFKSKPKDDPNQGWDIPENGD